jgi:hypothetical protein
MLKNYPYRDQDAGGTGGPVDREALRILRDQNEVLFQILGNTRQRTEAQKEFASLNNDITKQIKDQLLLKETDVALDQTTVRSKEELAKKLAQAKVAQMQLAEAAKSAGEDEQRIAEEKIRFAQTLQAELKAEMELREDIDKRMGLLDNIAAFIKDLPGVGAATAVVIDQILKDQENAIKDNQNRTIAFLGSLKNAASEFANSFLAQAALIGGAVLSLDKRVAELQRKLGISAQEAANLGIKAAEAAGAIGVNSLDTQEALININDQLGIAATSLRADVVGEIAKLAKFTNLSAEAQANFALQAQISGQNAEMLTDETRAAVLEVEKELGIRQDVNKVLDEAGKITGQIRANLGFNIQNIARAISVTKSFGTSLAEVAGISKSLLDFQSSITAEFEAELFIGKNLNLERARLFALTGNYEGLTKEIAANAGSALEFAKMNVLQQDALAKSLGMSADTLGDMLFKQEGFASLAQQARDAGEEELATMFERRDLQQQFNDLVTQLKTIFVDLMTPLLPLLEGFSNLVQNSETFRNNLKIIAGIGLGLLVANMTRLAISSILAAAATGGIPGIIFGLVAAGAAATIISSAVGGGASMTTPETPASAVPGSLPGSTNSKGVEDKLDELISVSRTNRTITADKFAQRSIYSDGKRDQTAFS